MEKKKLTSFIDKYHLAGNANSVKVISKDNTLTCDFITDDQNVVGNVTMNSFQIKDCELGIYTTSQLVKLLTALDTDVEMQVNKAGDTAFSINLADPDDYSYFYVGRFIRNQTSTTNETVTKF